MCLVCSLVHHHFPLIHLNPQKLKTTLDSSHCSAKESTTLHVDAANPSLSLTKSQCRDLTKRIAFTLRHEYGVGASKTPSYVTCISTGSYVLPNVFYGVVAAGGIFSSASSSATVQELVRFIKLAPSNLVICNPDTRGVTLKAAMECDIPEKRVLIIDAEGCTLRDVTGRNVLRKEMLDWRRITDKKELEQTVLCLIFSSGTTGLPKGKHTTYFFLLHRI
jgi:acyl-coenzyme A synthetase/AMP-(fatty) acid ligase